MKKLILLMLMAVFAYGQNMLVKTVPIYSSIRPVRIENSNNAYKEVLTQQGGLSIGFPIPFNIETVDSIRLTVGYSTNAAGTTTIKFENRAATLTASFTSSGVISETKTSAWLRTNTSTLDTFKLYAKSSSATTDIDIYYASYETKRIALPGGAAGIGTVQEGDVTAGTTITTMDFGPGFDLTESPAAEINVVLDYTEDPVDLSTTEVTGVLTIPKGGLNLSSAITANYVLGASSGGATYEGKNVLGTSNQLTVAHGVGTITLSTPQNTHSGASPTFAGLTLSSPLTMANGGLGFASGTTGDIFYLSGATTVAKLAAGTTSQYLQGGTTPSWANRTIPTVTTSWVPYFPTTTTMADAFFWEPTNKTIGIGIATGLQTSAAIQAMRTDGNTNYIYVGAYAANAGFMTVPYGGTFGSPAAVPSGQSLMILGTRPYNGSAFTALPTASFQFIATETHAAGTDGGTKIRAGVTAENTATQIFPLDITNNGLEVLAGFNLRIYDADGSNVGIFTVPSLASNFTYTGALASGDIATLSANGFAVRTAAQTWASRSIVAPAAGFTITAGNGVAGDPTFVLANDLAALEAMSTTGIMVRSASETYLVRSLANASAGLTWTNGDGIAGNPTPALANDLAALEALSTTGLVSRTGSETYTPRTVTGTAEEITVTNGDGVSGNPTLSMPDVFKIIELPAGFFNPLAGDLTGATALATDPDNTNDWSVDELEFSASAENYMSGHVTMPEDWDATTAPKFKVVYYSGTGHASNVVEWDISARYLRHGTDSWIAAQGTAATTTHNPTTANIWYETSALQPTPAGTAAVGATLQIRIWRDGDDASDTHTATARLVKVLMSYKKVQYGEITDW